MSGIEGGRAALSLALADGMADLPEDHALQVAMITSIVSEAFAEKGMECTLVGGSAIEVRAPGIYKSGDIDLVIERRRALASREELDPIFQSLGFGRAGRHWVRGDLFIEVSGTPLIDPAEIVRVGPFTLRVIAQETLLADRVVGFKHWRVTAYGQQAIDMIVAFGETLRMEILRPHLEREGAVDAFAALRDLALSAGPVTDSSLQSLLEHLTDR